MIKTVKGNHRRVIRGKTKTRVEGEAKINKDSDCE